MTPVWVNHPGHWLEVADLCHRAGVCGWDTETYGHDVHTSSPAYRARIDVWSLATADGAWVLPAEALVSPALRGLLEDPDVVKVAHNARHDLHAAENAGVTVRGVYDTLEPARVCWPQHREFHLKALRVSVLGKPARDGFKELTAPQVENEYRWVTRCTCGDPGCRRRKAPHDPVPAVKVIPHKIPCPIESIGPGHPRWQAKLEYAAEDAVDALDLFARVKVRLAQLADTIPELPW